MSTALSSRDATKPAGALVSLKLPKLFDNPSDWPAWIEEFEEFRFATGLNKMDTETQVRMLLYTM